MCRVPTRIKRASAVAKGTCVYQISSACPRPTRTTPATRTFVGVVRIKAGDLLTVHHSVFTHTASGDSVKTVAAANGKISDNIYGGEGVIKCDGTSTDSYCCDDKNVDACNNGTDNKFILSFAGTPYNLTTIGATAASAHSSSAPTTSRTSTTSTGASRSTAASNSASTGASAKTDSSVKTSVAKSSTSTYTSATAAPTAPMAPHKSGNHVAIGVGVGVPVGVLVAASLIYLIWRHNRGKNSIRGEEEQSRNGIRYTKAWSGSGERAIGATGELPSDFQGHEVGSDPQRHEIASDCERHEMSAPQSARRYELAQERSMRRAR
ncbi:MAG: hypothetical protein M1819_005068 [Sarea resinae]|nr:MAG: hypothetical protein M1819_005068 [Sarea resinae]